nr:cation diffusion facilitator family transporter [Curtanaerobium respiraculi]
MEQHTATSDKRQRTIVRASAVGVGGNILLTVMKAIVGILSNSIAITVDAVNNLTDAAASLVTMLGAKLANRQADKGHPMGHGRYEYLSALVVAMLIVYAGITALVESGRKILEPVQPDYSALALGVIALSIVIKIFLAWYMVKRGKETDSQALVGSGIDARYDVVISLSVLAAALVYLASGISLEAYVGIAIALIIAKAGFDMIRETIDNILGHRVDRKLAQSIKRTVESDPDVRGAYDLLVDNYGPELLIAQIHVEVDDTMTAAQIDDMTRRLQTAVMREHDVVLATVGIYDYDTQDPEIAAMREAITEVVLAHEGVLQLHGFHASMDAKIVLFDLIVDFGIKDRRPIYNHIVNDVKKLYPDFAVVVTLDRDLSD